MKLQGPFIGPCIFSFGFQKEFDDRRGTVLIKQIVKRFNSALVIRD
jgi:hypothetical protein